jgi:serine/threonine protein kinase
MEDESSPRLHPLLHNKDIKELKEDVALLLDGWKGKSVDHSLKELKNSIQKRKETSIRNLLLDKQDIEIICKYVIYRCKKENLRGVLINNGLDNDILCYKNEESSAHSPNKDTISKNYSIYNLGSVIGKGSDGVVRFAQKLTEETIPSIIAVKNRESYYKSSTLKSCEDEYRILQYIGFAKDYCILGKNSHFIFMEYFPGCPVSEMAKDWHNDVRSGVATGCLEAVYYLYTVGIYHCDIKPENFLITCASNPNWLGIKLIDYGSSIMIEDPQKGSKGNKRDIPRALGTPSYMPPECFNKLLPFDREKVEIYSLCITIFEILSLCLWLDYQVKKPPFSLVMFQDIQKACPDVFLNKEELDKLKISDRWKFELLEMCYWIYKEDPKDRPSFYDLKNIINRISKIRDDYVSFSFPSKVKSKSNNNSPRNSEERPGNTHHHRSPRLKRNPFSKTRNLPIPTITETLEVNESCSQEERRKKYSTQANSY